MTKLEKSEMEIEQKSLEWLLLEQYQEFLVSQGLSFGIIN